MDNSANAKLYGGQATLRVLEVKLGIMSPGHHASCDRYAISCSRSKKRQQKHFGASQLKQATYACGFANELCLSGAGISREKILNSLCRRRIAHIFISISHCVGKQQSLAAFSRFHSAMINGRQYNAADYSPSVMVTFLSCITVPRAEMI